MWESADYIAVSVKRNASVTLGFQVWDEVANAPLDISAYVITCKVAEADGKPAIVTINANNASPALGEFDLTFNGPDYDVNGDQETVNLSLQIIATSSVETVTMASGRIELEPGIN